MVTSEEWVYADIRKDETVVYIYLVSKGYSDEQPHVISTL